MRKRTGLYIASACVAGVAVAAQHFLGKGNSYTTGSSDALLQSMKTRLDEINDTLHHVRYDNGREHDTLVTLKKDLEMETSHSRHERTEWTQG